MPDDRISNNATVGQGGRSAPQAACKPNSSRPAAAGQVHRFCGADGASLRRRTKAGAPNRLMRRRRIKARAMRQVLSDNRRLQTAVARLRQSHTALEIDRARFFGLARSSVDHIFMLDSRGTYLFSNDRVGQFGLAKGEDLVGRTLRDVYRRDLLSLYLGKLDDVIRRNEAISFHHHKMTSSGFEDHLDTLYPVHCNGRLHCIGGVCTNISEQKTIEKQLFQAQKMEALGALVAGVAHEINNPINLLLFNLPLLEKMWQDLLPLFHDRALLAPDKRIGGLAPDFIKRNLPRLLSDMDMAAQRVARIVSGLKGFARKSNPAEKWDVQVNLAVKNAARLAGSTLKKSQTTLEMDLAAELPLLRANLQNLEQIILNLIINALESIGHDHGRVRIATRLRREDQAILIDVIDNGRGVNPAVADNIFDPFITDRQAAGGTGLGLSVTYNLVKAHNGEIYFQTRPGKGTTFTVVLPIDAARSPCTIMVVDDDNDFREMIIRALNQNAHCVTEGFSNGAEALIHMGSHPPDLLILDMFMPEMDGLGVCRAIKSELGLDLMKVIIVTGFPDHPNLYEAARMGFSQILTKPLAMEEFIGAVRENLNERSIQ